MGHLPYAALFFFLFLAAQIAMSSQPSNSLLPEGSTCFRWSSSRPSNWHVLRLLLVISTLALSGCHVMNHEKMEGNSPLAKLIRTEDQTQLEILFVRIPQQDYEVAQDLWDEVDEHAVPADLRRELGQNGFRAGVVESQLPPQIAAILENAVSVEANGSSSGETASGEPVGSTRRQMMLRRGQRGELIASSVQPVFHVLQRVRGEAEGRSYQNGQGIFSIKATPTDDDRVKLQLTPEVHHGEFRNAIVQGDGMFRFDTSRPKQLFDPLRIEADLSSGQIIVIGAKPARTGSLGYRFFNEQTADKSISKLLLIHVNNIGQKDESDSWETDE